MTNKIVIVRHGDDDLPDSHENNLKATVALIMDNKVMVMDEDKSELSPDIAQNLDPSIISYEFHELDLPPNWGGEEVLDLVTKKEVLDRHSYKDNLGLFISTRANVDFIESPTGDVMTIGGGGRGRSVVAVMHDNMYHAHDKGKFTSVFHELSADKKIDALPGFNHIAAISAQGNEADAKSIVLTVQLTSGESIALHNGVISKASTQAMEDGLEKLVRPELLKLIAATERFINYKDKQPESYEMGAYKLKEEAAKYLSKEDQNNLLGDNINPYAVLHALIDLESRNYYYGDEEMALFVSNGAPVYSPYICEDKIFGVDPHEHYTDGYHQLLIDIEKSNGNTLAPDLTSFDVIDFDYDSKDNQVKYKDQTVLAGLIDIKDEAGVTVFKEMVAYNETDNALIIDSALSRMSDLAEIPLSKYTEIIETIIIDEHSDSVRPG